MFRAVPQDGPVQDPELFSRGGVLRRIAKGRDARSCVCLRLVFSGRWLRIDQLRILSWSSESSIPYFFGVCTSSYIPFVSLSGVTAICDERLRGGGGVGSGEFGAGLPDQSSIARNTRGRKSSRQSGENRPEQR